jgi:hypothetical protein
MSTHLRNSSMERRLHHGWPAAMEIRPVSTGSLLGDRT